MLLFAPDEAAVFLGAGSGDTVMIHVAAAAALGFATMNWTARSAALGGIYGRAVVTGNQTHLVIGALLLVSRGVDAARSPAYWVLTGLYVAGALFLSYLLFFSSGLRGR